MTEGSKFPCHQCWMLAVIRARETDGRADEWYVRYHGMHQHDDQVDAPQSFNARIGAQLQWLRKSRDLSQRQVAEQMAAVGLPLDSTAITRIEGGSRALKFEEAVALGHVLYVRLEDLLDFTESDPA